MRRGPSALLTLAAAALALGALSCGGFTEPPASSATRVTDAVVSDSAITALHFYDSTHGWAVSTRARRRVELSTTSDGHTWHTTRLPIRGFARDIEFVNKLQGWVAVDTGGREGSLAILRTSNGGRSWRTCRIADVTPYEGGFSFTGREGWLVGARADDPRRPVALCTRDGGATWQRARVADGLVTLTSVVFQEPPLRGWVSGYDNQHVGTPARGYTTGDGGRTWAPIEGTEVPEFGLVKVDDSHIWALGESRRGTRMLRWDPDTGAWNAINTSGEAPTLFDFGSDDAGWGVRFETGEEGVVTGWRLLATTDGGRTWTDAGADIPAEPTAICCPAADTAMIATVAGSVVTVRR